VELRPRGRGWLVDPDGFARPEVHRAVKRALHARAGAAIPLHVDVLAASVRRYAGVVDARFCRRPRNARLVGLHHLRPSISRAHAGCRVVRPRLVRR
jgi:hypothetical protein